jgi:hypothetical protein
MAELAQLEEAEIADQQMDSDEPIGPVNSEPEDGEVFSDHGNINEGQVEQDVQPEVENAPIMEQVQPEEANINNDENEIENVPKFDLPSEFISILEN